MESAVQYSGALQAFGQWLGTPALLHLLFFNPTQEQVFFRIPALNRNFNGESKQGVGDGSLDGANEGGRDGAGTGAEVVGGEPIP